MKAKDLSKKLYETAHRKGNRGYRLEYDTNPDKTVTLARVVLIEKDWAEASLTMADMVSFVFAGIDEQVELIKKVEKAERLAANKGKWKKK